MRACTSEETGPVTVVFVRRVRAGKEPDYESHLKVLHHQLQGVTGYLGTDVVRDAVAHEYVSVVRFDSLANLSAWEASGQRERWQLDLDGIVDGDARVRRCQGLEFWFEGPSSAVNPPSKHKMALVLVVLVTSMSFAFTPVILHYLAGEPRLLRAFVSALLQVTLLTYVIMPRVTRALAFWLFDEPARPIPSRENA
jgi:antibiotic biosynthesis monooxygenase (ABM) superfamily enzyme